jgi:hypothetical protein
MVQYRVKPEHAADNERLIRAVFAQLADTHPAGVDYRVFALADGVSFVHVAEITGDNQLTAVPAFKAFLADHKDRVEAPPVTSELRVIGSYAPAR